MREIKFRGKRIDNNEWAYGYYVKAKDEDGNECHFIVYGSSNLGLDEFSDFCILNPIQVHPDSVGMWTGFKDKNEIDVYYDDIAWHTDSMGPRKVVVIFDFRMANIALDCPSSKTRIYGGADLIEQLEVIIGNTTDNPELIKEKT